MLTTYQTCLLQIARDAILESLTDRVLIDAGKLTKQYPELLEPGSVFVTLNQNNHLRGCIGSIESRRSLLEDIIGNARSAAFNDHRFTSVEASDVNDVEIEISILSKPEPVFYNSREDLKNQIKPFTDGIILSKGYHKAVFLPQVWEKLSDFDDFFENLCKKAGLPAYCLFDFPQIEKFNVTIIEEQ